MSFLSDVVSNPSKALGGAFNFGTPGQSDYSASGYTPDPAAFDNPQYAQQYAQLQAALQGQQAQQGTAARNQAGLVAALQAQMAGNQPSVAQQQLAQSTAANNQAALAAAASAASVDPSLALRNATQAQAANDQNMAGQAAVLRAGEQAAGEQTLAGVLGGQQQLATQAALALQGMQGSESQTQTQNQIAQQQLKEQAALGTQGINAGTSMSNAQSQGNLFGSILGGGAAGAVAGLLSDRRAKTDLLAADKRDIAGLLDAFKAYLFRYRGEKALPPESTSPPESPLPSCPGNRAERGNDGAAGSPQQRLTVTSLGLDPRPPHLGVMAQDLERSPLGRQMVIDTPQGKAIDPGQATGALLAASANLNDRLSRLEDAKSVRASPPAPARMAADGSAEEDGIPASPDAADTAHRHESFLARLIEVGKLGAALEKHHGIEMAPEGLVQLMAAAMRRSAA